MVYLLKKGKYVELDEIALREVLANALDRETNHLPLSVVEEEVLELYRDGKLNFAPYDPESDLELQG